MKLSNKTKSTNSINNNNNSSNNNTSSGDNNNGHYGAENGKQFLNDKTLSTTNGSNDKSNRIGHGLFDMLTSAFKSKVSLTENKKPTINANSSTKDLAPPQRPSITIHRQTTSASISPSLRKRSSSNVSHSSLVSENRKRDSNGINYVGFINALSELQQQQQQQVTAKNSNNNSTDLKESKLKADNNDDDNEILYTIRRDEPTRTPPPSMKQYQTATLSDMASSSNSSSNSNSNSSNSSSSSGNSIGRITKRPAATTTLLNNPHSSSNSINNYIKDIQCILPKDLGTLLQQSHYPSKNKMKQRKVPLLIDMRPLEQFERAHITNSININVPTLLIKRYRRGVIPNNFNLESFITTPEGTDQYRIWLEQFKEAADDDEIRVIIYDDHTTSKDKSTGTWTLAGVIYKIIHSTTANTATEVIEVIHGLQGGFHGFVEWDTEGIYLEGSQFASVASRQPTMKTEIPGLPSSYSGLDSPPLPLPSSNSSNLLQNVGNYNKASPTPMISRSATTLSRHHHNNLSINTSPDATNVHRRASLFSLDTNIRPSNHKLRPINIPQLNERRKLNRNHNINVNTNHTTKKHTPSASVTHLKPTHTNAAINNTAPTNTNVPTTISPVEEETFYTPMTSKFSTHTHPSFETEEEQEASLLSAAAEQAGSSVSASASSGSAAATPLQYQQQQQRYYPNAYDGTVPLDPPPPTTAVDTMNYTTDMERGHTIQMAAMTPKTEHEYDFVISEIIPKFLYLGPEILTEEQVMDLKHRSIKRVLNMAEECDDDVSGLKETFAYQKIAARDTVEMQNVQGTLRKAVRAIDDSKKHHEPIYVHCKAGKSRSAAAILAYLVLSEHWTLKKAYQHIVKARPNISPNIGFVAELMKMEEGVHGQVSNFASTDWQLMLTNPPSPDTQKEMGRLERVWKRGRSSSNVTRNTSLNSDTSSHRNSLDSSRSSIGSKTCSISWNEDDEL